MFKQCRERDSKRGMKRDRQCGIRYQQSHNQINDNNNKQKHNNNNNKVVLHIHTRKILKNRNTKIQITIIDKYISLQSANIFTATKWKTKTKSKNKKKREKTNNKYKYILKPKAKKNDMKTKIQE